MDADGHQRTWAYAAAELIVRYEVFKFPLFAIRLTHCHLFVCTSFSLFVSARVRFNLSTWLVLLLTKCELPYLHNAGGHGR